MSEPPDDTDRFVDETVRLLRVENERLRAEIERLTAENENLRRWKALDKPLTAAMEIANSHLAPLRADNERLQAALLTAMNAIGSHAHPNEVWDGLRRAYEQK